MEYINRKNTIPFEVHAFTSLDQLRNFVKNHQVEILLISEKAMCTEVGDWPISKIVILSEGIHDPGSEKYPSVYKYQSSSAVVREVLACYGGSAEQENERMLKPKMTVIGIYSPVGRCLKTSLALAMGQILAKEKATLYLNLEDCPGFETLFHTAYDRNISDIIYYLRQGETNLISKIAAVAAAVGKLDFLPPARSPQELRGVTAEEWHRLFTAIRENSSYEILILDIGSGPDCLGDLLGECDYIYMPVKSDTMSAAKLAQFESLLRLWDCENLMSRIKKLHLPVRRLPESSDRCIEQLVYTELGEYAENLVRKDGIIRG